MRNLSPGLTRRIAVAGTVVGMLSIIGVGAVLVGSRSGTPAGSSAQSPTPAGICPPPEANVGNAESCVSIDPNANYRSNHMFQERMTPAPALVAAAGPLAAAVKTQLSALSPGDRQNPQKISDTLVRAGLPREGVQVGLGGTPLSPIPFGAFTGSATTSGVCVYGSVSSKAVEVEIGGLIQDGGCLPPKGGH